MYNPELHLNARWQTDPKQGMRHGFGDALVDAGQSEESIVVVTADLAESTKVDGFAKQYPQRFFDVGVAEQNLMGVSAGLASVGLIPICSSYAMFHPGRNWDQLRNLVCYSHLNVKVVATHAGLSVGPDGATHQALEDIALTRVLPHLTILSPCDYFQTQAALRAAISHPGPVYLRLSREASFSLTTDQTPFLLGQAQVLRFGSAVTIVSTGLLVGEALKAAQELDAEVINLHTLKPLDVDTVFQSTQKTGKLVIVEEHQQSGGVGSAVLEAYITHQYPLPPTKLMGVNDQFGQSGTSDELLSTYGLTWEHIVDRCKSF